MKKLVMFWAALGVLSGSPAQASPDSHASCVGLIVSDHARWGELQQVKADVRAYIEVLGISYGEFVSMVAQQHLGSHQVCGNE